MHADWIIPVVEALMLLGSIAAVLMKTGALVERQKALDDDFEEFKRKQGEQIEKLRGEVLRQLDKGELTVAARFERAEASVAELRGYLLLRRDK